MQSLFSTEHVKKKMPTTATTTTTDEEVKKIFGENVSEIVH